MKKFKNLVIGGIENKIFNLVLITTVLIMTVYLCVILFQSHRLTELVSQTNARQKESISQITSETMNGVLKNSMGKSTKLEADSADSVFKELKSKVTMISDYAAKLYSDPGSYPSVPASLPDAKNEGKTSTQIVYAKNTDINSASVSREIAMLGNLNDMLESMYNSSEQINSFFIASPQGFALITDDRAGSKFDSDGKLINVDVCSRPWYKGAESAKGPFFTDVEKDSFTDKIGIVCSIPVYNNGRLVAVAGADLFLDSMVDSINSSGGEGSFNCIINQSGHIIFSPKESGLFKVQTSDAASDLRQNKSEGLASFVNDALKDQTEIRLINIDGKDYYVAGAPMSTVGWAAVSVVEKDVIDKVSLVMNENYESINSEATAQFRQNMSRAKMMIFILLAAVFIISTANTVVLGKRIVKPLEKMTKRVAGIGGSDLLFKMEKDYETGDEIEVLAKSFADLSAKTLKYVEEIKAVTAEKERIGVELDIAGKIQSGMLPNIYPAFPERPEFDIYATMTAAKEVGGDFYDFFLIDDDHLGIVMADVSGKGVPAALFMMASKILINNFSTIEKTSPAHILELVNEQICKNNPADLFVTVWLGILEISTGKIKAANAGHEYPCLRHADGGFELYKDRHGFVVGGMNGSRYKEYEITLEKNDSLFLYTDGVPEATNAENQLFGTDNMLKALNIDKKSKPEETLENVRKAVNDFVKDAPQFDDLTMLCLEMLK